MRRVTAYYNEIEPYAAEWLRNLIAEGLIAPGDVDERGVHPGLPGREGGGVRSNGITRIKPRLPRGARIRKAFYGLLTALILGGLLSGLLLAVIALNVWAWRWIVEGLGW